MKRLVLGIIAVGGLACGPRAVVVEEPPQTGSGTGTGTGTATGTEGASTGSGATDPLATAVERVVTLYEVIATLPPARSCSEAAASIDRWTDERADALAQVRDAARGEQADLVDGLFHDASTRLATALRAIDELSARCASEPAVAAALARMSTKEPGR